MTIALRPMRWWDLEQIVPLELELFPDDPWSEGLFWSELAYVPESRWYLVAEEDGLIVGYGGLLCGLAEAEIQTLGVRAAAQGRGLGGRLLSELLAEAERRGLRTVLLEVRVDNERALALYRKFGFQRVGRRPGYYAQGRVDGLVLRRRD